MKNVHITLRAFWGWWVSTF